jgi:hypothetical protein
MSEQSTQKLLNWQELQQELIARALKDEHFRRQLLDDPKAVVEKEMRRVNAEAKMPADLEVKVIVQPTNAFYLVLPEIPGETSVLELAKKAEKAHYGVQLDVMNSLVVDGKPGQCIIGI